MSDLSDFKRQVYEPLLKLHRSVVVQRDALAAELTAAKKQAEADQEHLVRVVAKKAEWRGRAEAAEKRNAELEKELVQATYREHRAAGNAALFHHGSARRVDLCRCVLVGKPCDAALAAVAETEAHA